MGGTSAFPKVTNGQPKFKIKTVLLVSLEENTAALYFATVFTKSLSKLPDFFANKAIKYTEILKVLQKMREKTGKLS